VCYTCCWQGVGGNERDSNGHRAVSRDGDARDEGCRAKRGACHNVSVVTERDKHQVPALLLVMPVCDDGM